MDYSKNIISIKFAQAQQPKFEEKKSKGYIEYGANNDYAEYLLGLYNESPKHGAIIKNKAKYIYGKGFDGITDKANTRGETWNQIFKKAVKDDEIFSGYYLQIIWNLDGKIKDVFHIKFKKVRTNKECTKFFVKNDWKDNKEEMRPYTAFKGVYDKDNPSQILFVKQYNPDSDIYPIPDYFQGLNYIESDVQVSRHILGNAKDGFVATTLINLNGGQPEDEKKAAVERDLKKKFTGSEGDRVVIMFNSSKDNSAEIVPLSSTMLTKEDFTNVNNLINQEIFACHQVTSPVLFGIKTEGQLGGRDEITEAYEIFNNTYVNERQQAFEETFNALLSIKGINGDYKITPVQPLGFSVKEEQLFKILPREYFLDELGVDVKYYDMPPVEGTAAVNPSGVTDVSGTMAVNENLKGMSGRQFQQLERIIRKYKKGLLSADQAKMMLRNSFALSDDDINVMLTQDSMDQQFASQEELDFSLLEQFGQVGEDKNSFEILSKKPAAEHEYFAEVQQLSQLESNILNLISKDKRITSEVIATTLKQDKAVIEKAMSVMEKAGLFSVASTTVGQDTIIERTATDKGVSKPPATTTDILLRYSYEGPQDERNRPFCAKLMELNRLYSRSDIEQISERLGYSVWDRRGGWFTQPNGEHRPYCRHRWFAVTVIKKK
jgi:predicted transcriptional regulator